MMLKFKNPAEHELLKVMVYGLDGTGKSTFATKYCQDRDLSPVVIDIEDTNRTALYYEGKVLDLNFETDTKTFSQMKDVINEIKKHDEIDTIIIDGVTSLLDMLVSNSKGLAKYSDRALRFQKLLQILLASGKNLIFIGQIDMEVQYNDKFQSSRAVIKVNSLVNEKYLCEADLEKKQFNVTQVKNRTLQEVIDNVDDALIEEEPTIKKVPKKSTKTIHKKASNTTNTDDPIRNKCLQIKQMLEKEGKNVNKSTMKAKVINLVNEGTLPAENRPLLIEYIQEKCPEEL